MSGSGSEKKETEGEEEECTQRKSVYTQIVMSGGVDCLIRRKVNGEG